MPETTWQTPPEEPDPPEHSAPEAQEPREEDSSTDPEEYRFTDWALI